MPAIHATLQTIASQLKGLSPAAKMLLGSLMVILVMSLFLVSLYAGRQDLVPLGLGATVTAESRARAIEYLRAGNIDFEVVGTDLHVPVASRDSILAYLTESQLIGPDQINFDRLLSDDGPFRTRDQNRQRYLVAKMNVLGSMISQMTGIDRATVVLDSADHGRSLGSSHVPPSASVNVLARSGELSQSQVDAIARLVAGSHAGLKPQNVAVIDARTGRALQARTDDAINSGRYMELQREAERHVKSKIESALGYIPGVRVEVNALVDTKEVLQRTRKYDEPKLGVVEDLSHSMTSTAGSPGSEPGVRPNVGVNIASSRGSSQVSDERSQTSSIPYVGNTASEIKDPKGYALQINASIGVPKSYFVRVFQDQQNDQTKMPDVNELNAIVQAESDRIRSTIVPLIDTQPLEGAVAGTVAVSQVPDFGMVLVGDRSQTPLVDGGSASAPGSALVSESMVKYITLGALALLSLGMMFLMVRKAGAREVIPTASELVGIPPALAAAESDLVGEADEASPALEGLELNDEAIRRQQMLDQITEMVESSPDEAANLLRRWMKSEA